MVIYGTNMKLPTNITNKMRVNGTVVVYSEGEAYTLQVSELQGYNAELQQKIDFISSLDDEETLLDWAKNERANMQGDKKTAQEQQTIISELLEE